MREQNGREYSKRQYAKEVGCAFPFPSYDNEHSRPSSLGVIVAFVNMPGLVAVSSGRAVVRPELSEYFKRQTLAFLVYHS